MIVSPRKAQWRGCVALVWLEGVAGEKNSMHATQVKANPADESKVKDLEKKLKVAEAELGKARGKSDVVEAKCKGLQDEIMNAGGEKLRMQKKKVEGELSRARLVCDSGEWLSSTTNTTMRLGMTVALEEATSAVSKGKVTIKSAHKAVEKAEAAAKAAEDEVEAAGKDLEKARADHKVTGVGVGRERASGRARAGH